MKKNLFSLLIIISIFQIIELKKNDYELLLEWGKNNSVYISDKIGMNYINENNKTYYVKEKIKKDEIIISIPKKLLINIETSLSLLRPKIKKQYEYYKKQNFKNNNEQYKEELSYRLDQSFLAYLMTVANKNKSKKNKFYQFYKYFFNTFETDLEKYPVSYNTEQIRLLIFSLFGNELMQTKEMFDEEYEILEKEIYKKLFDQDEYYRYRIFTFNKLVNISNTNSIIPFVDMLETNPINFNLELNNTLENDSICVVASKDIEIKDKLNLAVVQMTNSNSLIIYGKVYKENKNYVEQFRVPIVSLYFLREKNLDPMQVTGEVVDLTKKDYYELILPTYIDLSLQLKEDGSKISALRLFMQNLQSIRNEYDKITVSELYKNFFKAEYVQNIRTVLDTEKWVLNKKIREMKQLINKVAREMQQDL